MRKYVMTVLTVHVHGTRLVGTVHLDVGEVPTQQRFTSKERARLGFHGGWALFGRIGHHQHRHP